MNYIERLILGHMPFVGISYLCKKKDMEYNQRFSDISTTKNVLETAIKMGLRRFAAATPHSSSLSPVHLKALKLIVDEGHDIELFPCVSIPIELGDSRVDAYRRWATYANLEGKLYSEVMQRILNDPILNFRENWKQLLPSSKPYNKEDFGELTIDWNQIDEDLEYFVELPVNNIEYGSEIDFLTMADRSDLLGELIDRAKSYGFKVLLGVHHAGMTLPMLRNRLGGFQGCVTPLNPLGIMMFPTKLSAEKAVLDCQKPVYAIKPLAGGRVSPRRAFSYVFGFNVDACMIGVSSIHELEEDVKAAARFCAQKTKIAKGPQSTKRTLMRISK